ncbi:hypothetical protein HanIR_Chr09g0438461 [Helianthus annuus]|nr:hypothetical protein HanIR_Chr09g0438461 [Helianthus annuus]
MVLHRISSRNHFHQIYHVSLSHLPPFDPQLSCLIRYLLVSFLSFQVHANHLHVNYFRSVRILFHQQLF